MVENNENKQKEAAGVGPFKNYLPKLKPLTLDVFLGKVTRTRVICPLVTTWLRRKRSHFLVGDDDMNAEGVTKAVAYPWSSLVEGGEGLYLPKW